MAAKKLSSDVRQQLLAYMVGVEREKLFEKRYGEERVLQGLYKTIIKALSKEITCNIVAAAVVECVKCMTIKSKVVGSNSVWGKI